MHGCLGGRAWLHWGGMVLFGGMHGFIRGGHVVVTYLGACVVNLLGGHAWFYSWGHVWFYSWGHVWFYSGGHVWFYLGGMRGFMWGACVVLFGGCMVLFRGHAWFYSGGACVVFSVFSDTMRYSQWAGGTHPTGMHSCFYCSIKNQKTKYICCNQIRHNFLHSGSGDTWPLSHLVKLSLPNIVSCCPNN